MLLLCMAYCACVCVIRDGKLAIAPRRKNTVTGLYRLASDRLSSPGLDEIYAHYIII